MVRRKRKKEKWNILHQYFQKYNCSIRLWKKFSLLFISLMVCLRLSASFSTISNLHWTVHTCIVLHKLAQTCSILHQPDLTCINVLKLAQTFSSLPIFAQACTNLFQLTKKATLAPNSSNLHNSVQASKILLKLAQTCSSLHKPYSNLHRPAQA